MYILYFSKRVDNIRNKFLFKCSYIVSHKGFKNKTIKKYYKSSFKQ